MLSSRIFLCLRSVHQASKANIRCVHCLQKVRKCSYRKYTNVNLAELERSLRIKYTQIDAKEDKEHLPPLFIHHGLFGSKKNWQSLSKAFHRRTGRRIIVIDARNHGESEHHDIMNYHIMANDAWQLIKELDLQKVVFIGHSMGGKVAMSLALTHPDVVDKLIVEDSAPGDSISNEDIQRYISAKMNMNLSAVKTKFDAEKQLLDAVPNENIRQFLLTNLVRTDGGYKWRINLEGIENNLPSLLGFPSMFPTEQYDGETLFIGGGRSNHIQKHHYPTIHKLFPKAVIKYISDSGHWIHSEQPLQFLDMVLEFISEEHD